MKIRLHRWLGVAIAWLGITSASAYDFQVDGIYYDINADEATVTVTNETGDSSGRSYSGEVIIPQSVAYNKKTYSVTSIGDEAFAHCYDLTSVTIPESVTTIGESAFYYCSGLTEVMIPHSVTSIGSGPFAYCLGLQSIVVTEGNASYSSSEGVLFNKDKTALIQCPGGKSGAYMIPSSVTTIGVEAFFGCSGLTSVTIPNSVTVIESETFSSCFGLTEMTIPNSVKTIGEGAFSSCTGLTSVAIGNSVSTIENEAFAYCSELASVMIPNSVTSIGSEAFAYCTGLTSVTIGNSVTSIGNYAFVLCNGLESIKSYATIPPAIEANTFSSYNATLYVPVGCGSAYRKAEHWANFTNIVESIDSRVEALQDENIRVYTVDNSLHVENGGEVYQVYTLAGQLVYTGNDSIIPLDNPGIYIVRTGERSQKVIVR